uniref:GRIP1 associated protein 1 n=1 Tax=Otolemur garnettii TaxID=30611 RepID=H0XYG0_OTOGA
MAQALSEEEFQRMQAQLLELRTNNYQLSDELRKNGVELASLRQKVAYLDKEFNKAQKHPDSCLPLQEVEVLLNENEMLQAKLHSQEEDFRLQNSTLMAEFSKLCSQMEQLEQENQQLKEGAAGAGSVQAISPLQERYGKEARLSTGVSEGQGDPPGGLAPTVLAPMPLAEVELKWEMEKEEKRLLWEQLQGLESSKQAETSRLQEELAKLSEKLKKKQESFCRLQTEKETLFNDSRNKIEELQQRKEADLKAQLARTQKLQQELEAANQSLAELRDQRQGERLEHAAALRALQDQVSIQSADAHEQVEGLVAENTALRTSLAALEQIQTAKTQELNMLREQTTGLTAELQQRQAEYEGLMGQKDDLNSQLQVTVLSSPRSLILISGGPHKVQWEGWNQEDLGSNLTPNLLAHMYPGTSHFTSFFLNFISYSITVYINAIMGYSANHLNHAALDRILLQTLRAHGVAHRRVISAYPWAPAAVLHAPSGMISSEGAMTRPGTCLESLQQQQQEQEEVLKQCREQHAAELKGKEEELQSVRDQLQQAQEELDCHLKTISILKQEVKDTVDGQRILEKKGSAALKDLKRQLHLERKRADKLQERLQDILTNSKSRSGLEELVLSEMNSPSRTQTGDSTPDCCLRWVALSLGLTSPLLLQSLSSSPQAQPPRPAELSDEEVAELFQRLAETQQEKWMLEEKVKHLEVSSASMAEDLCRKSAIIETYVMDSRIDVSVAAGHTDRSGLGSVLRDLVKPGDENLREMNKKLQNMLEEQLTKNMHLHK